jgi:hypothetical protein
MAPQRPACGIPEKTTSERDKSPFSSILLVNMQSLENKLDELSLGLFYQCDLKNCNILCFSKSWLNKDMVNINLAICSIYQQDRTTASGDMCLFVNNRVLLKVLSRFRSPELEYLLIS